MTHAFEYSEYVGISTVSIEDAMKKAVEAVSATKKVAWFEVLSVRGRVAAPDGTLEYQVTLKFGCKI
jgi:flavin-binding protein dodecin